MKTGLFFMWKIIRPNVFLMSNIVEDIEGMTLISSKTAEEGIEMARAQQPRRDHSGHQPARHERN